METTYTWESVLDMTVLNSVSMTLDWYNRKTTGILMQVNVPTTFLVTEDIMTISVR